MEAVQLFSKQARRQQEHKEKERGKREVEGVNKRKRNEEDGEGELNTKKEERDESWKSERQRDANGEQLVTEGKTVFSDLGVRDPLVFSLKALGIVNATPVQRQCVPRAIAGSDIFAIAPTGTGKTAAFAVPILDGLIEEPFGGIIG